MRISSPCERGDRGSLLRMLFIIGKLILAHKKQTTAAMYTHKINLAFGSVLTGPHIAVVC